MQWPFLRGSSAPAKLPSIGRPWCQRGRGEVEQTLGRGAAFTWLHGPAEHTPDPQMEDRGKNESRPCVLTRCRKARGMGQDGCRDSKASDSTRATAPAAEPSPAAKHSNEKMPFFPQPTPHKTQDVFHCFGQGH